MPKGNGFIVIMGSGELTATMVEVHKEMLSRTGGSPRAVFLDTPAGFQLNADEISRKAVEYFRTRIQHAMTVASLKSAETLSAYDAEQAFHALRQADYILVGPGSPTYAVRQWEHTPVRDILCSRIDAGACLVAASAAALTMGTHTLPVYEIYKVGQDLHWQDGMNILPHFGLNLTVIPHWNNAEGGTHDTRFCFMGGPRFDALQSMLPEDVAILGLDEHTACIIDLAAQTAEIRGVGRVILRRGTAETVFQKGDRFSLDVFRNIETAHPAAAGTSESPAPPSPAQAPEDAFWQRIHAIESAFQSGMETAAPEKIVNALLELDQTIWNAHQALEDDTAIAQAREILRECITLAGTLLSRPADPEQHVAPLVEDLVRLRADFRNQGKWPEADAVRDCLQRNHIIVEDAPEGTRWHVRPPQHTE